MIENDKIVVLFNLVTTRGSLLRKKFILKTSFKFHLVKWQQVLLLQIWGENVDIGTLRKRATPLKFYLRFEKSNFSVVLLFITRFGHIIKIKLAYRIFTVCIYVMY